MTDAFLYAAARTPFGRFAGALAEVRPDDLAATAITGVLAQAPELDPGAVGDVVWGCANQAGEDNRNVARMAALLAGLPESVAGVTVNRLCASGLSAVVSASHAVVVGDGDLLAPPLLIGLALADLDAQPVPVLAEVLDVQGRDFGAPQAGREAQRQDGAVSFPREGVRAMR